MLQIEAAGNDIWELIDAKQELEVLADARDGLVFTEGPIWNQKEGHLTFSDIAGNTMYRWNEAGGLQVLTDFSFKANGNAYDTEGNIVSCEHAASRIVRRNAAGGDYEVLCSHYEGKELNSPNDIVVKSNGDIYFTDPHFGRNASKVGVERKQELDFQGVYRLSKGKLTLEVRDMQAPNGLCFTADEQRIFVNDSPRKEIKVFDIAEDGSLCHGSLWAVTEGEGAGLPDGMKLDVLENLYCCAQGGLHIFRKDGVFLGRIVMPVQVANFCFGGKDRKEMFLCSTDRVYRLRGKISGL